MPSAGVNTGNEDLEELQTKVKLFEDLAKIKQGNKRLEEQIGKDTQLSKQDQKQLDKITKEQDKLEMQAMVLPMKERDDTKKQQKGGSNVLEGSS